jgi:cytochrome c553
LLTVLVLLTGCNSVSQETIDTGKKLYTKCSECHGENGDKKALKKSALLQGQSMAEIEKKLKAYKAGTRNVAGMGAWKKGMMKQMNDTDIEALAAYISTF